MKQDFNVVDMTCGHCVARITKALQAVDPEARLQIDLASRRVRIDGAFERADYAAAIRDAGYAASETAANAADAVTDAR